MAEQERPTGESWASSPARRKVMQANRSRDTGPELALRRELHARGLRYRVAARPIRDFRRTADVVFRPAKVAVFVDGCFWHSCPEHGSRPSTNVDYWTPKLARNVERDRDTDSRLAEEGWLVIRVWEHEETGPAAERIEGVVRKRRGAAERG